eukprot:TRINITY_DN1639_c0_g1_i11.p1 TRINITY_DN1639_c0_g1~~TRINITY_DN1639_c0_g1_i11.p1  ORF type:complete len:701 (+),score=93.83 TRINITY_DN1639_c0_g1_i11:126-2228(+)
MQTSVTCSSENNNSVIIKESIDESITENGELEITDSFQFPTFQNTVQYSDQMNNGHDDPTQSEEKTQVVDDDEEDRFDDYNQIDHRVNEVISDNVLLARIVERLQQQDPRELKTKLTALQQSILGNLPKTIQPASIYDVSSSTQQTMLHFNSNHLYQVLYQSSKNVIFQVEGKKFYVPEKMLERVQDSALWELAYDDKFEHMRDEQGCIIVPVVKSNQFDLIVAFLAHSSCALPAQDSQDILEILGVGQMLKLREFCKFIRSHREGLLQIRMARDYIYYHPIIQGIIDNFKKLFFAPDVFPTKWAFEIIEDDHKKPHWYTHVIMSYYDGFKINPVWFTKQWEKYNNRQAADYFSEAGSAMSRRSKASIIKSERLKRRPQSEYSVYFNEKDWPQETTFGFLLTSEQLDMAKIYNYHAGLLAPDSNEQFLSYQDAELCKNKAYEHWLFNFFIRYVREVQVQELYRNIRIPLPDDLDQNNINNALSRALRWRLKEELGAQLFIYHIPYQDPEDPIKTTPYFVQSVGEGKPVVHEFSVKLELMVPTDELQKHKPISNISLTQSMQNLVKLEREQLALCNQSVSSKSQHSNQPPRVLKPSKTMSDLTAAGGFQQGDKQGGGHTRSRSMNKVISFPIAGDIQATSFVEALKQRRQRLSSSNPVLLKPHPDFRLGNSINHHSSSSHQTDNPITSLDASELSFTSFHK